MEIDIVSFAITFLIVVLMVSAAVIDARTRTFPNGLALAFVLVCALFSLRAGGLSYLAGHVFYSILICIPFIVFEYIWRSRHSGNAGIGMGDLKFLAAFALVSPQLALISFLFGLIALALIGLLLHKPSLPLLPFVVAAAPICILLSAYMF